MWTSTVGLVNGKHRYLTAETFGFKINSNGQVLKKRQQWTIEPFPENLGPDGSISSAASVSSQAAGIGISTGQQLVTSAAAAAAPSTANQQQCINQADINSDPCILTFSPAPICSSLSSVKSSSNGSSNASDQDVCGEEHENVAIKSHLNKYLAVDSFGNVTCDSDEKTENARFTITICSMSQGKSKDEHIFWAFKNVERGYYLGTTDDGMVCCNAKMPKSRAELWHLHLIPARGASFFALKSLGRRRFARVASDDLPFASRASESNGDGMAGDSGGQVQLDSTISWGPETLFQFKYYEGGRYSLLTSDCKLLTNEGKCIRWSGPAHDESSYPPPECLFTLEYHSGFLAFRDSFSHYLAAAGRSSVLRSRSIGVSRDELFAFEPAPIQVSLKTTFNNRWVSIKQGVDLSANQTDTSPKYETFQLTYHKQTRNWSIMTQDCNFWTVLHNTGTVSVCKPGDYEGLTRGQFRLIWSETDASFSLQFIEANPQQQQQLEPKWISARKSGQLFLSNGVQPPVQFIMRFQNRRLLNLRPVEGSGFVGIRPGVNSKQLDANKTSPDSFAIEYPELPASSSSSFDKAIPTSKCNPPQVGPKPSIMTNNNNSNSNQPGVELSATTVNLFNVKLNSTKLGKTMLEKQNNGTIISDQSKILASSQIHDNGTKEVDCSDVLDDNNNHSEQPAQVGLESSKQDDSAGSVESGSAPSVASIINSFSNVKLANKSASPSSATVNRLSSQHHRMGSSSSTARLASAFNGQQQHLNNREESDIASVITSCSSASSASSNSTAAAAAASPSSASSGQEIANCLVRNCDQLAQLECCYLKTICNDRYLVVNDKESGVSCEATNKACAQSWIIELRSHNSIAIRASDNHAYMQLGTNGTIFLSRCEPKDATLWEF